MNSRQKGKRIELEAAHLLRDCGFTEACRGAQHSGSPDSPDVKGIDGWHIEVKGCEKLNLDQAIQQAKRDAGGQDWMVLHKKNRTDWKVTLDAKKFLALLAAIRCNTGGDSGKLGLYPEIPVIVRLVSEKTGALYDEILGSGLDKRVVEARQIACWIAFSATAYPSRELAEQFKLSEGNFLIGVNQVAERRKQNTAFMLEVESIFQKAIQCLSKND